MKMQLLRKFFTEERTEKFYYVTALEAFFISSVIVELIVAYKGGK